MTLNARNPIHRINWRVDDFCAAHGVGRSFVYEEIRRGALKIVKAGRRTLIPADEALRWQAKRLEGRSS